MGETPGKKLRQARLKKKLSVDEVARSTRIRSERIHDLENDEYGNFPNLAYGRNFLLLYARHLGLDSFEITQSMERHSEFGLDDYEYLTNTSANPRPVEIETPRRSLLPYLVIAGILLVAVVGAFLAISAERLGDLEKPALAEAAAPAADSILPSVSDATAVPEPAIAAASPIPTPLILPVIPAVADPSPTPAGTGEEPVKVMRAVPIEEASTPAPSAYEVVIKPLKRTFVTVHQGGPGSPVVFSDYLDPTARPLTLKGERFFIEAENSGENLQIIKNGQEVAYTAPGLTIE